MARALSSRAPTPQPLGLLRCMLTVCILAAFALQSFVVQTHVHFAHSDITRFGARVIGHGHKLPSRDDPANCPICQEMIHSGQFVAPTSPILFLPTMTVSTIAVVDRLLPFILALSHSWQGRAPPHII